MTDGLVTLSICGRSKARIRRVPILTPKNVSIAAIPVSTQTSHPDRRSVGDRCLFVRFRAPAGGVARGFAVEKVIVDGPVRWQAGGENANPEFYCR